MTYEAAQNAIKQGDIEELRAAFGLGLDPDLGDRGGWTILMLAASTGNLKIGELIIHMGADLNKRNAYRDTALSLAALCGRAAFVELLLTKGASLEGYPHGNSLDTYLDWLASFFPERMLRIRKAFDVERESCCA